MHADAVSRRRRERNSPEAGIVGSAPPTLAHSLVISANRRITVTFPVSVALGLAEGTHITNTVVYTAPLLPAEQSGSVALMVANAAPQANDDAFTVLRNAAADLDVLANDSDANGDALTIHAVGTPDRGGTALNGGAIITYTPAPDLGTEVFTYTVSDGHGGLATAWVTVTVKNDPPSFTSAPVLTATEDTPYTYAVAAADPDLVHGDILTITAPTLPGWLKLDWTPGTITATLAGTPTQADLAGDNQVVLRVTDQAGLYAEQRFVVGPVRVYLPPVARNASSVGPDLVVRNIVAISTGVHQGTLPLRVARVTQSQRP